MCEHCHGISRRRFLAASALGLTAAALAGCPPASHELPDAYDQLEGEPTPLTPPPKINPRTLVLPPPTPPERTDYGDILPRRAWTSSPLMLRNGRPIGGISLVTLHHSGDGRPYLATSLPDTIRHLQIVREAHLQRGMIDIAYHFAVDRVGRVWQLRSLLYEGQHVRIGRDGTRWNAHNLGIVTLGDFNLQLPTIAQYKRLLNLVRLVRSKYALPSTAVHLHGELVRTDCPGRHLASLLRAARRRHEL